MSNVFYPDGLMDLGKALEIVHALARQNLDDIAKSTSNDEDFSKEQLALDTVEDFITNNFEDFPGLREEED